MRNYLDKLLNKAVSKKLTVFLIGTIFVLVNRLDGEQWLILSSVYVGTQGAIDLVKEYLNKN